MRDDLGGRRNPNSNPSGEKVSTSQHGGRVNNVIKISIQTRTLHPSVLRDNGHIQIPCQKTTRAHGISQMITANFMMLFCRIFRSQSRILTCITGCTLLYDTSKNSPSTTNAFESTYDINNSYSLHSLINHLTITLSTLTTTRILFPSLIIFLR